MTPATPQLAPVLAAPLAAAHLTSAQMEALLTSAPQENAVILAQPESPYLSLRPAQAHLLLCPACAAELANLRDSLSLFRQASSAHANHELQSLPPISVPNRGLLFPALQPAHWFAVAATLLIAILPIQSFRLRSIQSTPAEAYSAADTTQSDAALLDDVDREASASVPAPMQALSDPTATGDTDTVSIQAQTPDQTPQPVSSQYPAQRNDQP
jgi:hypothetical protein